jgi:hypothetical protein
VLIFFFLSVGNFWKLGSQNVRFVANIKHPQFYIISKINKIKKLILFHLDKFINQILIKVQVEKFKNGGLIQVGVKNIQKFNQSANFQV